MIKEHRKLSLKDFSGRGNDASFEVNWNTTKTVKDCAYIRLKVGDREAVVSRDHLWSLLMLITTEDQQEQMIPTLEIPTKHYSTVVNMQAQADIAKGQIYGVPLTVSVDKRSGAMSIKPG